MKKMLKSVLALFMIFTLNTTAFAAVNTNASSWAKENVENAYELGLVPDNLLQKATTAITRGEFCTLVVSFYRAYTGESGVTLTPSPFYDAKGNNAVAFAAEKGIVKGVTETSFRPNAPLTREQMAMILFRTLEVSGANTEIVPNTYGIFSDMNNVAEAAQEYVKKLAKVGVLNGINGKFKPKDNVTVEEAVTTFLIAYNVFKNYDFEIGNKKITMGQSVDIVKKDFGEPDRIDINQYGFERYVYNKDYKNFIMIGINEGKVAEIYTNSSNFKFKSITPQTKRFDIDNAVYEDSLRETATVVDSASIASFYFDKSDEYSVDAVYIKANTIKEAKVDNYNEKFSAGMARELFDIINASRVRRGLKAFQWDDNAAAASLNHSVDMKDNNYLEYNNKNGMTPFERMKEHGVSFTTAAETISKVNGDAITVYNDWFRNNGTRSNLMSSDMTHVGVGVATKRFDVYTTMDLFCPQ